MNPAIFREYDIRGLVGRDLNAEVARAVGRAFGSRLKRRGRSRVALGQDVRESSPQFAKALREGLCASGIEVHDAGVLPTPVLYYAIEEFQLDGGLMVTGSHNPVEYNGIKICEGTLAIYGEAIQELRRMIEEEDFEAGEGRSLQIDVLPAYEQQLMERFRFPEGGKVVVDCGNGVAGPVVMKVLQGLGLEVIGLYTEPDGTFPNHLPDPEVPEYMEDLRAAVSDHGALVGFGFDGDGDRLGVIDETGRKISADWLLALFARDLLKRHPGGRVRFDVKCTDFLFEDVEKHGGVPVMGRTGHSILKADMKEMDAIIGGELSGHIVYGREYFLIDDPLYCALKFLQLMSEAKAPASGLFADYPETHSTAEIKIPVPDGEKFDIVRRLTDMFSQDHEVTTIDGARVLYEKGWGLVRASNTTANLTVRFEARSARDLKAIADDFTRRLGDDLGLNCSNIQKALS